jgi:hypothetical protein
MQQLEGIDFIALDYDGNGKPTSKALDGLLQHLASSGTTDLMLMAHGFRNSEGEARSLYRDFLKNFKPHVQRDELKGALAGRKFAMAGIFWPSKAFNEGGSDDDEGSVQGVGRGGDEWEETRAQLADMKDEFMTPAQPRRSTRHSGCSTRWRTTPTIKTSS